MILHDPDRNHYLIETAAFLPEDLLGLPFRDVDGETRHMEPLPIAQAKVGFATVEFAVHDSTPAETRAVIDDLCKRPFFTQRSVV